MTSVHCQLFRDKKVAEIKYHLAEDVYTRDDLKAWTEWILSQPTPQFSMGPLVKEYEQRWSEHLGMKHSLSCNSGSSANLLMPYALLRSGRLKNKKVIVPSAAWATSVAPFIQLGFEPIMCDADQLNFGLNPYHLTNLIREHDPATVILVHVLGVPSSMEKIMQLKRKFGFFLLEDTCAAMGSTYRGKKLGTFGEMSSMSTYYGHQIPTIEGGMVTTNDTELYNLLLMLRSHGWVAHLDPKTRMEQLEKYKIKDIGTNFHFIEPGFNFRFNDVFAFLGLRQLDQIKEIIEIRSRNHELYRKVLRDYFITQVYDTDSTVCSIHFCALAKSYDERNFIIKILESAGIETRPYTSGNQGLEPYWFREYGKFSALMADKLYRCGFFLPNNPSLDKKAIKFICGVAIESAQNYRKVKNVD